MSKPTFTRLTPAGAAQLLQLDKARILDTRDDTAFQVGHIENATRLHSRNLEAVMLATPRRRPVLIYCYHGNASQVYAQMFADFGFVEVYDLVGGYEAWRIHATAKPPRQKRELSAELMLWLIQHGFTSGGLNTTIANATTPLMHAARRGEADRVRELIAAGADLNALNLDGNNALWLACFADHLPTIALLLKAGIDKNHQNDNGATCLMYAASAGRTAAVATLLAAGADVRPESLDGFTALDMAANIECLHLLRRATPRKAATEQTEAGAGAGAA